MNYDPLDVLEMTNSVGGGLWRQHAAHCYAKILNGGMATVESRYALRWIRRFAKMLSDSVEERPRHVYTMTAWGRRKHFRVVVLMYDGDRQTDLFIKT